MHGDKRETRNVTDVGGEKHQSWGRTAKSKLEK